MNDTAYELSNVTYGELMQLPGRTQLRVLLAGDRACGTPDEWQDWTADQVRSADNADWMRMIIIRIQSAA